MAYVVAADFGGVAGYLSQVDIADASTLTVVESILDRATDIVNKRLGFSFEAWGGAAVKNVRAPYGAYFNLPAHQQDSVTLVKGMDNTDYVGYWEETDNGRLYAVDVSGNEGDWGARRYKVTAIWGYGPVPESIKEVTLEIAVNVWQSRQAGRFSRVVGVQGGGAVGYEGALTPTQKMILDDVKDSYTRVAI